MEAQTKIEPNKFYQMTNAAYHYGIGSGWISKSVLSKILGPGGSPRIFKHNLDNPERPDIFDKTAVKFNNGTAFHTRNLEPEKFDKEIVTVREFSGKGSQAERNEWRDKIRALGQVPVSGAYIDTLKALEAMLNSGAYEEARQIIQGKDNFIEMSGFWIDPETGIYCKIRPDLIRPNRVIWDLKNHTSIKSFRRQAMDLNYDFQAVMCLDGVSAITGVEHDSFGFVVFHSGEAPYDIEVVMADDNFIKSGKEKLGRAKGLLMSCTESGKWPGKYEDGIELLSPPKWRLEQLANTIYE